MDYFNIAFWYLNLCFLLTVPWYIMLLTCYSTEPLRCIDIPFLMILFVEVCFVIFWPMMLLWIYPCLWNFRFVYGFPKHCQSKVIGKCYCFCSLVKARVNRELYWMFQNPGLLHDTNRHPSVTSLPKVMVFVQVEIFLRK